MSAGISIDFELDIPPGLDTLDDFRRWVHSGDFPEEPRIHWIGGKLEIEMAPDNVFWHSSPKSEIGIVIGQRIREADVGHIFIDKTLVTMPDVDLSCEPDVFFVSHEAIADGRVIPVQSRSSRDSDSIREIEGSPDLVVEIVSDGSVNKDNERLFRDYFDGGVTEYWLVDARGAELSFQIFARGDDQFVAAKTDDDGYQLSEVFDTWYRFTRERGQNNLWRYDLSERE